MRGRLIAEVDLAIGAEPHAEERKVAEHPERGLVLRDAIERGAGRGAEACQQRTHADPRAIAPDPDQQHAREQRAAPRVADGAEEGQEHEQTGAQPEDAAAAQREDERQRHDDDGDHRQVATQQLLAHARGAQERAQADAPGVTGPRGQPAQAEEDRHREPRREVIGIAPRGREAAAIREVAPGEQPRLTGEIVEEPEEAEQAAEGDEHARQPAEVLPRGERVHHEVVDGDVAREEQRGVERLARPHAADRQKRRREVERQRAHGLRGREGPRHERAVAEHELEREVGEQQKHGKIERRAAPAQASPGDLLEQPRGDADAHEQAAHRQRPRPPRARGEGRPEEQRIDGAARDYGKLYRLMCRCTP